MIPRSEIQAIRDDFALQSDMVRKARTGDDEARAVLVEVMTPLIIRYVDSLGFNDREDRGDLINEGHLATLEAIDLYDEAYEAKFITYAFFRVRKNISWWLAQNSGTIPMPYEAWRVAKLVDGLEEETDRTLTSDELEELTGKGYAREAANARRQYVTLDVHEENPPTEILTSGEVVEFVRSLVGLPRDDRYRAARQFCELHDIDPYYAARMVIVAEEEL